MQPILMIALVGVAASALGVGFLSNTISLNVQTLGVGEQAIANPFTVANIDLKVKAEIATGEIINKISACSFHTPDQPSDKADANKDGTYDELTIICKLTDKVGDVIAEGQLKVFNYEPSDSTAFDTITVSAIGTKGSTDVQVVHDIRIVAKGTDPTPAP